MNKMIKGHCFSFENTDGSALKVKFNIQISLLMIELFIRFGDLPSTTHLIDEKI